MKKLLTIILSILAGYTFAQQDTVVKWSFPNVTDTSLARFADVGLSVNLTKKISAQGFTATSYTYPTGVTTFSVSSTGWASGNGTKYWMVDFETTGYDNLKLFSKQRSSNTGPRDFKVEYRIGTGGTWTDVPGATVLDSNNWTYGVLTNISLPTACDNQSQVFLRWIMTSDIAANGTAVAAAGTSRIDDIIVVGDQVGVGLTELAKENKFTVSPNPSNGQIIVNVSDNAKEIMIYDLIGNKVYENANPLPMQKIDLGAINKGFYLVKVRFADNKVITKKLAIN